jgi:hypothetical protein
VGEVTKEDELEMGKLVWDDEMSFMHRWAFVNWHMNRKEWPRIEVEARLDTLPSTLADIEARRLINKLSDAPMKSISIHNEGCELETLKENFALLKKYRPKIDVACYHNRDGLYLIEKTLMDILSNYRWKFRLHGYMGQAAYIYGTPEEKL